ncbi:hypothetical protein ACTU44_21890 (plasmid) [Thalassospira sp. SM2505]
MLTALVVPSYRIFKLFLLIFLLLAMNEYLNQQGATTVEEAFDIILAMPLEMLRSIIIDTVKMALWPLLPFGLILHGLIVVALEYLDDRMPRWSEKIRAYVEEKNFSKPDTE